LVYSCTKSYCTRGQHPTLLDVEVMHHAETAADYVCIADRHMQMYLRRFDYLWCDNNLGTYLYCDYQLFMSSHIFTVAWLQGFISLRGRTFLFTTMCSLILGQPFLSDGFQGVLSSRINQMECETDHLSSSSAELRLKSCLLSAKKHATENKAWCLKVQHVVLHLGECGFEFSASFTLVLFIFSEIWSFHSSEDASYGWCHLVL